jgi:GR25 family glycosyltransferase involved in LPS biosynthesis
LLEQLSKNFPNSNIKIIEADRPSDIPSDQFAKCKAMSELLIGRTISEVEVAVAFSHQKIYRQALLDGCEIATIFEDDIEVADPAEFANAVNSEIDLRNPTIMNLFSPNWSLWKKKQNTIIAIIPPPYAAAYKINKRAMEIATLSLPVGVADWPIWSRKINFNLVEDAGVRFFESQSFVDVERIAAKSKSTKYRSFFNLKFAFSVNHYDRFLNIFWYPLLWDFYKMKNKKRTKKLCDISKIILEK